jgi:hypothetical protein
MTTSERECIEALREAAERLGESPTKKQYEQLDLTPSSTTIRRIMGGWNEAKEAAGLETYDWRDAGGGAVQPKPEDVEIPNDVGWDELSGQQRWYYKNREERIARKDRRRAELRRWLHELKRDEFECAECDESRPPALDFHHPGEKDLGVARMVQRGYSKESIRQELERCEVLCANCHRVLHYEPPDTDDPSSQHS